MKVLKIEEQPDGSAIAEIEMSEADKQKRAQFAKKATEKKPDEEGGKGKKKAKPTAAPPTAANGKKK